MIRRAQAVAVVAIVLLTSCSQRISSSSALPPLSQSQSIASGVVRGSFTEYALPAGATPNSLTAGDGNLWFAQFAQFSTIFVYRFNEGSGHVATFTHASHPVDVTSLAAVGNDFYLIDSEAVPFPGSEQHLVQVNAFGAIRVGAAVGGQQILISNVALGNDGNLWHAYCLQGCDQVPGGGYVDSDTVMGALRATIALPDFIGVRVASGGDGNVFVTASYNPGNLRPPPVSDSAVFVISPATHKIIHTLYLPNGSAPQGLVSDQYCNMWITEPGINKIARVTRSGSITQFTLPTPGAEAANITLGADKALWFTETRANKIGRITTAGSITEFAIPTVDSGASGITPCYPYYCFPKGGVYFAETAANKMGKFNSSL